jgi:hypothetical protein
MRVLLLAASYHDGCPELDRERILRKAVEQPVEIAAHFGLACKLGGNCIGMRGEPTGGGDGFDPARNRSRSTPTEFPLLRTVPFVVHVGMRELLEELHRRESPPAARVDPPFPTSRFRHP